MAEAGGPATQAGIYYQNTVAALYLGRMLDLRERPTRLRVMSVRLEAPEAVDDIIAHMGDGSRRFIQAKVAISLGSDAWVGLWSSFTSQFLSTDTTLDDRLVLAMGEASKLATDLRDCCERTTSATSDTEYLNRLTKTQKRIIDSILQILSSDGHDLSFIRKVLARSDVEIIPNSMIERDQAPLWMPEASVPSDRLLGILRDLAGGASRYRASFEPAELRARLKSEYEVDVAEPSGWGGTHYRSIIAGRAVIEIPGTSVSKQIDDNFPWPKATRYDRTRQADFDDETPRLFLGVKSDQVDLSLFPESGLERLVVVAGPGLGKSVLTIALAAQAIVQGRLPAIISIPDLAKLDISIGEYLSEHVNTNYQVAIDWMRAAETGLLVLLLDGLDEVSSDRRAVILERIKTFALRHPKTPWLLTVRDAAALAAPTDALLVELEPLDDDHIERHIRFYRPENSDLPRLLQQQLEIRPEVHRLARIPLFLAILLATVEKPEDIPSNRTDLLETYLHLLFQPEQFKQGESDSIDSTILRPIAEAIAFEALERDEIGVNSRILEANIRRIDSSGTVQLIIERLVKCGALRRASPGRYIFPFPIVQEYLAACHISETRLEEMPERLNSAFKRPWAQAIQFVLEQHQTPNNLVRELLAREDDAFNTNLRLVARCVANGMQIDSDTRLEIGRRLANIWPDSPWRLRSRIGELIAEAFLVPLIPEIRKLLSNRWLLHDGAGSIVARANDPNLTKTVLCELLDKDIEHLFNLSDLQPAVDALGDEALSIYIARVNSPDVTEDEVNAIACLIGHLDEQYISESAWLPTALDTTMPLAVRLALFALGQAPIDNQVLPLIEAGLTSDDYQPRSAAIKALSKTTDPQGILKSALLHENITLIERIDILGQIHQALPIDHVSTVLHDLMNDTSIEDELRQHILVFSIRHGDGDAMNQLIDRFGELSIKIICATISLFGYHRSRQLVQKAVDNLNQRLLEPLDRTSLARNVIIGMTTKFEMDSFQCGALSPAPPHPGLDIFHDLLEQWATTMELAPLDALEFDEDLVQIGSESGLARLPNRIEAVLNTSDINLQDMDNAAAVGRAVRALQERRCFLSLPLLESIISLCSYNGASSASQMVAALGSHDAFDSLLHIYNTTARDTHLKETLLDNIETLASRLGLRVRAVANRLEATTS